MQHLKSTLHGLLLTTLLSGTMEDIPTRQENGVPFGSTEKELLLAKAIKEACTFVPATKKTSIQDRITRYSPDTVQIIPAATRDFLYALAQSNKDNLLERHFISYEQYGQAVWIDNLKDAYIFKQGKRKGSKSIIDNSIQKRMKEQDLDTIREVHTHMDMTKVRSCLDDPACNVPKKHLQASLLGCKLLLSGNTAYDEYSSIRQAYFLSPANMNSPSYQDLKTLIRKEKNTGTTRYMSYITSAHGFTYYDLTPKGEGYYSTRDEPEMLLENITHTCTENGFIITDSYITITFESWQPEDEIRYQKQMKTMLAHQ